MKSTISKPFAHILQVEGVLEEPLHELLVGAVKPQLSNSLSFQAIAVEAACPDRLVPVPSLVPEWYV